MAALIFLVIFIVQAIAEKKNFTKRPIFTSVSGSCDRERKVEYVVGKYTDLSFKYADLSINQIQRHIHQKQRPIRQIQRPIF